MGRMGGTSRTYSANSSDYKLLEEVGYGASATVYRAIYLPFNEVVAVKCLDLDRCNNNFVSFYYYICFFFNINDFDWLVGRFEIGTGFVDFGDMYVHMLGVAFCDLLMCC